MELIKVTGGDLEIGYWEFTRRRRGYRMFRTTREDWFRPAFVNFEREVVTLEEVGRMEYEQLVRDQGWAFARGPISSWLRGLGNALLGERRRDIAFRAVLADGRAFTGVMSPRLWRELDRVVNRH